MLDASRVVQLERMTPDEVVAARARAAVAFVPIGPLEWHGPHLPLGTDAAHAHALAVRAAERVGGVVLPPLFVGADSVRDAASLRALGLPEEAEVLGMDFPGFPVRSLYYGEQVLDAVVRETVRLLHRDGWRLVVLVSGHGAPAHAGVLEAVPGARHVPPGPGGGHAERWETSIMLALAPELVHVERLPAEGPLRYADFGIVDRAAFRGERTDGFAASDPRAASAAEGERTLAEEAERLAAAVSDWLAAGSAR
jgi:creatinine amidohydrolase